MSSSLISIFLIVFNRTLLLSDFLEILERAVTGVSRVWSNMRETPRYPLSQDKDSLTMVKDSHEVQYPTCGINLSHDEITDHALHLTGTIRFFGEEMLRGRVFETPEEVIAAYDTACEDARKSLE